MASNAFVILAQGEHRPDEGLPALGSRREILKLLAQHNTAPEWNGADEDILYGPGIRIELPPQQDDVRQMLLTITEEDIGWLVLMRLAKEFGWKVLDPNTGREFPPQRDEREDESA